MLRQYMVILPALHDMLRAIMTPPATSDPPLSPSSPSSSPSPSHPAIHGCALLTFLHHHSQTGVPLLAQVYRRLLSHLEKVLLHQMIHWMFYGILLDPFEEFFIRRRKDTTNTTTMKDGKAIRTTPAAMEQSGTSIGTLFDSMHFFHVHSASSASSSSPPSSDSFDWDTSFELVLTLLPSAYLTSSSLIHQVLFLGKAIRILTRGEKVTEERQRLIQQRRRRRREDGNNNQDEEDASHQSTIRKTRRSGSITLEMPNHHPQATLSLRDSLQPLLTSFHALRSSADSSGGLVASVGRLESMTATLHHLVSKRLYDHLLDDHGLLIHLDHLRRFVLLGDGTFVENLLQDGAPLLDRASTPAASSSASSTSGGGVTSVHTAGIDKVLRDTNGPVKSAMRECGLRDDLDSDDEDDDISSSGLATYPMRHLSFHIDTTTVPSTSSSSSASSSIGWKNLSFTYHIPSPLDLVFTNDIMDKYRMIMRFHIEVRRVHRRLKEWMPPTTPSSSSPSSSTLPLSSSLRFSLHLLRHRMLFFMTTLLTHIAYDVIESAHAKLLLKIGRDTGTGGPVARRDFDEVRKAQEEYLHTILSYCFLRDRVVSGGLNDLFGTCIQFCTLTCARSVDSSLLLASGVATSSAPPPVLTQSTLKRLSHEFDRQACFLFTILSRKTDFTGGAGSQLNALVSKLDFNGDFTRLSKELGLTNQLVPTAKGMTLSTESIQQRLSTGSVTNRQQPHASNAIVPSTRAPTTLTNHAAQPQSGRSNPSSAHPSTHSHSYQPPVHFTAANGFAMGDTRTQQRHDDRAY